MTESHTSTHEMTVTTFDNSVRWNCTCGATRRWSGTDDGPAQQEAIAHKILADRIQQEGTMTTDLQAAIERMTDWQELRSEDFLVADLQAVLDAARRVAEAEQQRDPDDYPASPWPEIQAAKGLLAEAYGAGEWRAYINEESAAGQELSAQVGVHPPTGHVWVERDGRVLAHVFDKADAKEIVAALRAAAVGAAPVEYVRSSVCLLCGDGVLSSGEHIDPERHSDEVERITAGGPLSSVLYPDLDGLTAAIFERSHEPSFSDDSAGVAQAKAFAQELIDTYVDPRPVPSGHVALLIQRARAEADYWRTFDDTDELVSVLVGSALALERLSRTTAAVTRDKLIALMEAKYPVVEPREKRNPNVRGDDPFVDRRDDERSAIEGFIDHMVAAGYVQPTDQQRNSQT